jgi:hypothetical protein
MIRFSAGMRSGGRSIEFPTCEAFRPPDVLLPRARLAQREIPGERETSRTR